MPNLSNWYNLQQIFNRDNPRPYLLRLEDNHSLSYIFYNLFTNQHDVFLIPSCSDQLYFVKFMLFLIIWGLKLPSQEEASYAFFEIRFKFVSILLRIFYLDPLYSSRMWMDKCSGVGREGGNAGTFPPPETGKIVVEIWCYLPEVYTFGAESEIQEIFSKKL